MNFRDLLIELDSLGMKAFTSRDVASNLGRQVREISNDHKRLHQMGFLKRKRKKRLCLTKRGNPCYRGYEYTYSISEQGRSYLRWMKDVEPVENIANIKLTREILDHLPQELKNKLLIDAAIRNSSRYKGPKRRFRLIDDEAFHLALLLSENQKLAKENRTLNVENEVYQDSAKKLNERIEHNELLIRGYETFLMDRAVERNKEIQRENVRNIAIKVTIHKMNEIHRNTEDALLLTLAKNFPEERLRKVVEPILRFEDEERTKLNQRFEAIIQKSEINGP